MGRLTENVVLNLKNRSHAVTAEVVFPDGAPGGANGTIIAQGGAFGGWSLYTRDGRLKYCYNLLGINRYYVDSDSVLPAGKHEVRMEFTYDGGGLGRGGSVTLYLDGSKIGEGRIGPTQPLIYSMDETTDVGCETGTTVAEDYEARASKFNGRINWIQLDKGLNDCDHLITPEQRLKVAMTRQ